MDVEVLYKLRAGEKKGPDRDWGDVSTLIETKDGTLVAVQRLATAKKKDFLVVGSERWPDVDRIEEFFVAPSGVVAARVKVGKKQAIAVAGKTGELYDDIGDVDFTPSGELVYVGTIKKKGSTVVRGERTYGPYDFVMTLASSRDGKHLAWIVGEGGKKGKYGGMAGGKWFVVVDGEKRTEAFDHVTVVSYGPQDQLGFIANIGGETDGIYDAKGGEWFCIVDGKKVAGPYSNINRVHGIDWATDGRVCLAATEGEESVAIFNGQKFANVSSACWLHDKPFWSTEKAYVIDGVASPDCDAVGPFAFTEGGRFAYMADTGDRRVCYVDGKPGPEFSTALHSVPVFSPDGSRVAYMANDEGKAFYIVDDQKLGLDHDSIGYLMAFSPDGKRFAYTIVDKGKHRWVVDGIPGPTADDVTDLIFSGDGARYAYAMTNGKGKKRATQLVIDGQVEDTFAEIEHLRWTARDNCFAAMATRGDERLLIRRPL